MTSDFPICDANGVRRGARTHDASRRTRRAAAASAILLAAALAGCAGSEGVTGPERSAPTPGAKPTTAIIGATTTRTPYEGTDENRCLPGEMVPVKGSVSYSFFVSSTDVTHEKVKFSWVMDGTGSLSGSVYHGSDEYLEEINVSILPLEETFEQEVHMISADKTVPDFFEKMLVHLTISGTGQVTATVDRGPTVECRS
jgi:hypothetical protein